MRGTGRKGVKGRAEVKSDFRDLGGLAESTSNAIGRNRGAVVILETRVFIPDRVDCGAAAHGESPSFASARVKSRDLVCPSLVVSPLASVHLFVVLLAVVAQGFVRVEAGFVAGAILPKDRFALGGVGWVGVFVKEFSWARVQFRCPITDG